MAFKNDPTNKRYFWLKLKENFYDQKEIKVLRRMPAGDTLSHIYIRMLLRSLESEGLLYFEGFADNFAEEVALDLGENLEKTTDTINYLLDKGLLEIVDEGTYFLTRVPELVGSESYSAERMRKLRNKKASQSNEEASQCDNNVIKSDGNVIESDDHVTKRKSQRKSQSQRRVREDIDIESESKSESNTEKESDIELEQDTEREPPFENRMNINTTIEDVIADFSSSFGKLYANEEKTLRKLTIDYGFPATLSAIYEMKSQAKEKVIAVPMAYLTTILKDWKSKRKKDSRII